MMIDIVRAEPLTRELLEEEVLFVRRMVGSDHAKLAAAPFGLRELARGDLERLVPGNLVEPARRVAQQWSLQPIRMMHEVEAVAPLDAEELTVDAATIAVVPAHDLVVAN